MEELSKILTELAYDKLAEYENAGIDSLIEMCNDLETENECFYRFATMRLNFASLLHGFVDGLEFIGNNGIDTLSLRDAIPGYIDSYSNAFFKYMKGRNND